LLLCCCLYSPSTADAADDDVAAMKIAIQELQRQNRALSDRLATLEAGRAERKPGPRSGPMPQRVTQAEPKPATPGAAPASPPPTRDPAVGQPPGVGHDRTLDQRVRGLEDAQVAQEDAVRRIIQESFAKSGSKINEFVTLGGAIETSAGWSTDFQRRSRTRASLDTAELDLEVRVNPWMVGNLTTTFASGTDVLFPTTTGFRAGVDRLTVEKASVAIGDTQRFPLFAKAGLDVLSFGTSTGFARLDTLAITGPLTTEVFEIRRPFAGFGFEFPTPGVVRPIPPQVVPQVRPMVINPLISSLARALGYDATATRPKPLSPFTFPPQLPPVYGSLYLYESNSIEGVNRNLTSNFNASLGYRTGGNCGRPYHELRAADLCPWSIDASVDYVSSIFDSRFLEAEYAPFLRRIGYVPGVAASVKASAGPVSLIAEWDGAIKKANFLDDAGKRINIAPATWQLSLGYQLGWNPWAESIGAQGTYVALGYSGSKDLAGVTSAQPDGPARVGFVPKHRLTVTGAEWFLDGAKLAVEYSHNWDYPKGQGGTGNQADGVFTRLTYVW
jgi:hypothetical protein